MDAWEAKQPLTKQVAWPWVSQVELVTMPRWHWNYFDRLCRLNNMTADDMHRYVSDRYPFSVYQSITEALIDFLNIRWDHYRIQRDKLANDNYGWRAKARRLGEGRPAAPPFLLTAQDQEAYRRARPVRHALPLIRSSPFKPMARPRQFRPEQEIRSSFNGQAAD